jgi:tetratricopeptide (TPR) repeat protein
MNRIAFLCAVVIGFVLGQGQSALAAGAKAPAQAAEPSAAASNAPAASSNTDAFAAGPACISEKAKKTLEVCPGGPSLQSIVHGKEPGMSFHSKVEELKKGDKKIDVGKADVSQFAGFRDLRQQALQQRALGLLITEIGQLETLYRETDARSKDRPTLLRRLAEDYVELENAAFKEKTKAEIARDEAKGRKNNAEAGKQQATVNSRKTTMERARKAAIEYYSILATDYAGQPSQTFPQNPPAARPDLDEIYYYLAYEYEQAGDTANARRVYLDLITKTPNSKFLSSAYLAFGELFFNEALSDPTKWDAAKQAYQKVIAKPPPENKIYGYAWYKLAYVFWNMGDLPHALDAFKRTIDFGVQFTQLPNAAKLAESGRRDVVPVYALAGSPTESYNFFKNLSGDQPGSNEKTFKMMDDLGQNYMDTGHYPEAIALYKDLMSRDGSSDKVCEYQSRITEATMAMKSGDKPAIVAELNQQFKRFNSFKGEGHSAESKQKCANRTAAMTSESAMAWHLEAIGSQGQRGTGDPKTMDLASILYKKVSDTWTNDEFSKFEFPRLVKEDWPTIYKIKYNMADLLYYREKWAECGPAFDEVVKENPQGQEAAEAAYAAVLCYQNIYLAQHQKGSDRKGSGNLPGVGKQKDFTQESDDKYRPKDLSDSQKAMIGSFNRYVCYIHPGKDDADGMKQLIEVKYARCRLYFEGQHWEEAGACFKEIAYEHSESDSAVYAAQLYLESINVLTFHGQPNRNRCIDDMIVDVPKFIEMFCAGDKAAKNEDTCTILQKVQCDIRRLRAQRVVEQADKGGNNALELLEKGGKLYFDLWEEYGAKPLKDNKPAQCEKLDEIVENAARAFQAGHLIASAIRARVVLLNPTFRMEKTELAKDAMYKIGGNYQAIAVYDQAADWFERYAKDNPHRKNADKALSDAIVLRLGLGQEDQAVADVAQYKKDYGNTHSTETAQIAFAIGAHYADKEDWDSARKALSGAMGTLDKAPPDIQVQAHATLARALMHSKATQGQAKGEYAKVRTLFGDGHGVQEKLHDAYKDETEDQRTHRLGKLLDAVGEAMFYVAEDKKQEKVDKIPFPAYKGPGTKDDIKKYMDKTLMPWVQKKQAAIEEADKEYQKITDLQPVPPPRWVIASASRAGLMWGNFVDDFRKAPYPKDWDKKGFVPGTGDTLTWNEVKRTYLEHLDEASEPIKRDKAKPALKRCLDDSVKYQYFDEYSRDCEKWLAKNYKTEYHVVDELRGAPTLSNGGLDDKPPPLIVGGQLWHPANAGPVTEKAEVLQEGGGGGDDKKKPAAAAKKPKK